MDEKEFFARLASVGPDGKFSSISRKKTASKPAESPQKETNLKIKQSSKKEDLDIEKNIPEAKEEMVEIFEGPEGQLAVDVYFTPVGFIIEAPVAGIKSEDIDISITSDSVVIKGKRKKEERVETKDYLYSECFWGRFSRSIILPEEIDADKSHATFKNGVLKIVLPKINRSKSKKIKVKSD
ncbi:hypothetical protein A2999_02505 [Candidatus Wolfebacteria bacterium RIFCSPLOWO2_01_FULL_38_11]|uniref:Protein containing Heat shock protein Hsp20 protein n=2 Tax=Candidatus Wolfeibacteriota TaxID=1752735 RepID=A0A0G0IBC3_9BACT|nr:MAG: Protein containing Heat shock protein Hsp20 protein [Candidatus Wolfebacteria bacterium GW2011_GWC1_37_10]OGM91338.1 MAG: hypothetical protein A2999_02505 [Candidatus Wolfebacteria bacterium RIFCSPLOWO2_01_FULL_38_11]